jgi:hypothetical protein
MVGHRAQWLNPAGEGQRMTGDKKVHEVISVFLAKKNAEDVESYLGRGRSLNGLTVEQLEAEFGKALRIWAADLSGGCRALIDVIAEFQLRDIEPRQLDKTPEWAVDQAIVEMSSERVDEIASAIFPGYRQVKEGEH